MPQLSNTDEVLVRTFAKVHEIALGVASGVLAGTALFVATAIIVARGGETVGPHLSLLSQYLPGYRVTFGGAFLGGAYGLIIGFVSGAFVAFVRNVLTMAYLLVIRLWANLSADNFLDRFDS
jgi:hypothetical protein